MKIGILTFHRSYNYGAVLQCYALQETLKSKGHDVYIIDYRQPAIEAERTLFNFDNIKRNKRHIGNIVRYFLNIPHEYKVHQRGNSFVKNFLNLTRPCNGYDIPTDIDVYIIGSDQLWNLELTGGIDKVYWGLFAHNKKSKLYTYAVSTKLSCIHQIMNENISDYVANFSIVSFRENKICKEFTEKSQGIFRTDIDPTLLADRSIWNCMLNKKWSVRKYIVFYQAGRSGVLKQQVLTHANNLAQLKECELIDLSTYKYSPGDFVSIIKYAQCVITTSFHGTAFSLIFERPFLVYQLNDGNDGRCANLLNLLELSNCIIGLGESAFIPHMDYSKINTRLAELKLQSMEYIDYIGRI